MKDRGGNGYYSIKCCVNSWMEKTKNRRTKAKRRFQTGGDRGVGCEDQTPGGTVGMN